MAVSARGSDPTPDSEPPYDAQTTTPSGRRLESKPAKSRGKHAREKRQGHPFWRGLREIVFIVVIALVMSALIRAFLIQAFYVPSSSMDDTLRPGDRIIASKITTNISGVERGEIVVFKDPGDWLPAQTPPPDDWRTTMRRALTFIGLLPSDSGDDLVKRVIGVGGDRVACCDAEGRIVVNGVPLDESYIIGPTDQVRFDITVPDDSMFVLGDNRGDSRDSRYHLEANDGAVPIENTVGRVFVVVWPFDRFAIERIPSIFGEPALNG
jgi:signal peptidase I